MYQLGRIYKIINTQGDEVYIGSTFNIISQRMREHKKNYKCWINGNKNKCSIYEYFKKNGIEKYKIVLIKEYNCYRENNKDFKHLQVYETLWINKLKCINETIPFSPLPKKFRARYYHKKNKEKRNKNSREYKKNNKSYVSEYNKQYAEKNKEAIKARESIKMTCICGNIVLKRSIKRHERSKKHINFMNQ